MTLVSLLLTSALSQKVRHDNHKVYRMELSENFNEASYRWLRTNGYQWGLDFWSDTDVEVAPENEQKLLDLLGWSNIKASVMIQNVQSLFDQEEQHTLKQPRYTSGAPDLTFFQDYRKLEEYEQFMDGIVATYPTLAKKITIGTSYENRTIHGVVITGKGEGSTKPGVYFEGGIHAREWISHTTVAYVMYTLVNGYGRDPNITSMVDSLEWTLVPVLNPDGYVFTWDGDRSWRKTRSPNKGSVCIGTDPNRNWDSHWCEEGASKQACSESYCGSKAFSEKETKASGDWVCAHKNIKLFIDFHSYSQLWMRPYGYSKSETKDARQQQEAGELAVAAIKATHGTVYQEGTIYTIIYPASGSSADFIYDTCGVKFAYGVELRDTGQHGFVLPADQIIPNGEEIFAATRQLAAYVLSH